VKKLLILSLLVVAGCATDSDVITEEIHQPVDPATVKVYTTMPEGAEPIGVVGDSKYSIHTHRALDAVLLKVKRDAAELGANGIIITSQDSSIVTGTSITATAIFVPRKFK
jgi:hypothetical protein